MLFDGTALLKIIRSIDRANKKAAKLLIMIICLRFLMIVFYKMDYTSSIVSCDAFVPCGRNMLLKNIGSFPIVIETLNHKQ
jgi:hypothetical protein